MYRYFRTAVTADNVFEMCLKPVRTEWTYLRRVWHTSSGADGKNWMSSTVLTCNIKHSGCPHTTPVSSPAFTPYHRDLQTTFPRPVAGEDSAAGQWAEWMTSYSCNQTRSQSVSLSRGRLSLHHSLITSPALEQSLVAPLAPLMYLNTHGGHTRMHGQCAYTYVCIYTACAQVHS